MFRIYAIEIIDGGMYDAHEVNAMFRRMLFAWDLLWWSHHVQRARMHDERMKQIDSGWRSKL